MQSRIYRYVNHTIAYKYCAASVVALASAASFCRSHRICLERSAKSAPGQETARRSRHSQQRNA